MVLYYFLESAARCQEFLVYYYGLLEKDLKRPEKLKDPAPKT